MSATEAVLMMKSSSVRGHLDSIGWGELPELRSEEIEALTGLPVFKSISPASEFPKAPTNRDFSAHIPFLADALRQAGTLIYNAEQAGWSHEYVRQYYE